MMLIKIQCECGRWFLGQELKEDTCPNCLKELINPTRKQNDSSM